MRRGMEQARRGVAAVTLLLAAGVAAAQGFPSKTIRLVSGVTPGSASDAPFSGTCRTSMPAEMRKRSRFMCVELPIPAEEAMSPPGFALAAATRSATVL